MFSWLGPQEKSGERGPWHPVSTPKTGWEQEGDAACGWCSREFTLPGLCAVGARAGGGMSAENSGGGGSPSRPGRWGVGPRGGGGGEIVLGGIGCSPAGDSVEARNQGRHSSSSTHLADFQKEKRDEK